MFIDLKWLHEIVDKIIAKQPTGTIIIESGASPSGAYHFGHLREPVIANAIVLQLQKIGRKAEHINFADDLDALRKVPVTLGEEYQQYIGKPLCDIPAPEGSLSYADYYLDELDRAVELLGIDMEIIKSHKKYRSGFFTETIEQVLDNVDSVRATLTDIAGRSLDTTWSPIQIDEGGYLKNREFVSLDKQSKTLKYKDHTGSIQSVKYDDGKVKLDWRLDWPARWHLLDVAAEPFGRDHASSGGSYDTGVGIMKHVFFSDPPVPVPYEFVNRLGDTKKMSASKGTGIPAIEVTHVLPAEVARFFMLASAPTKTLYFDEVEGIAKLIDEYAQFLAKMDKSADEETLLYICTEGIAHTTVSSVPFTHLVASYQAALKDKEKTIEIIKRTEHSEKAKNETEIIKRELEFIDQWLTRWAPDDIKFNLVDEISKIADLSQAQRAFLTSLADKVAEAPRDANGQWYHDAIYAAKETSSLDTKECFMTLYQIIIGKKAGPRAGWFLSILPHDWLVKRLRLEG